MKRFARMDTPLGWMVAIAEGARLVAVDFEDAPHARPAQARGTEAPDWPPLQACAAQISEYFSGRRERFDLPLAPGGTAFCQRVWQEIDRVPFGTTITYSELARRAGAPGAARAAGTAAGRNPLAIVVGCHRIVAKDGGLAGYAGGIARKRSLLAHESAQARPRA